MDVVVRESLTRLVMRHHRLLIRPLPFKASVPSPVPLIMVLLSIICLGGYNYIVSNPSISPRTEVGSPSPSPLDPGYLLRTLSSSSAELNNELNAAAFNYIYPMPFLSIYPDNILFAHHPSASASLSLQVQSQETQPLSLSPSELQTLLNFLYAPNDELFALQVGRNMLMITAYWTR